MYDLSILVEGFPGKSPTHGGLGWSTIALLQNETQSIIIDGGAFGVRGVLQAKLAEKGLSRHDITHVLLTHSHWDHAVNWTMFPNAEIILGRVDLEWALDEPPGGWHVAELYIKELNQSKQLRTVQHLDEVLPGITVHQVAGHTPGHVAYVLDETNRRVIFAGDAAKNKAELLTQEVDMTLDAQLSAQSIQYLWNLWEQRQGCLMVPGHDLPMILEAGVPKYVTERHAVLTAWFGETLAEETNFNLQK
ncbi:MAG TPA: MBL fold metallo-hydrolase [Ktedonobacteraceae bacterium]|jgi:glyoxylase-like metal-dependent hydrolase (beta-lactamase superfamily II)|nr:MBL fold metallo-hydrolase [Ktedonobacteraceae bacterium]